MTSVAAWVHAIILEDLAEIQAALGLAGKGREVTDSSMMPFLPGTSFEGDA